MIHRTCTTGSGSQSSAPLEEPSKPGPVHDDNAVELQREDSLEETEKMVVNPASFGSSGKGSSLAPEKKTAKDPECVDASGEDCGRERLKRHRGDVAGRVWIPDIWGQEDFLKDWIDCSAFDRSLFPTGITSARKALMEEGRRANAGGILQIGNRC